MSAILSPTDQFVLNIQSHTREGLLQDALQGLMQYITSGEKIEENEVCNIHFQAYRLEDMLVQWTNELIWLANEEGFLAKTATVRIENNQVIASLSGQACAWSRITRMCVATSLHALKLTHDGHVYHAEILIEP